MGRSESKKKIGIYGGTFNPIHKGHINAAVKTREELEIDEILFMPVHIPPHKEPEDLVSWQDRIKMIELSISEEPDFKVSDMEIKRKGLSYTFDTLRELEEKINCELFFILGTDSFLSFKTWHKWEEILKIANLAVINRPGFRIKKELLLKDGYFLWRKNCFKHRINKTIYFIDIEGINVSSTQVRDNLLTIKERIVYVDEKVEDYIKQKGLYR